ncbi:hypothetical protein AgCh_034459 [Apium graveolens]
MCFGHLLITPGGGAAPSTASWILRRCRGVAVVGFLQNNTGRGVGVPRRLRRETKLIDGSEKKKGSYIQSLPFE